MTETAASAVEEAGVSSPTMPLLTERPVRTTSATDESSRRTTSGSPSILSRPRTRRVRSADDGPTRGAAAVLAVDEEPILVSRPDPSENDFLFPSRAPRARKRRSRLEWEEQGPPSMPPKLRMGDTVVLDGSPSHGHRPQVHLAPPPLHRELSRRSDDASTLRGPRPAPPAAAVTDLERDPDLAFLLSDDEDGAVEVPARDAGDDAVVPPTFVPQTSPGPRSSRRKRRRDEEVEDEGFGEDERPWRRRRRSNGRSPAEDGAVDLTHLDMPSFGAPPGGGPRTPRRAGSGTGTPRRGNSGAATPAEDDEAFARRLQEEEDRRAATAVQQASQLADRIMHHNYYPRVGGSRMAALRDEHMHEQYQRRLMHPAVDHPPETGRGPFTYLPPNMHDMMARVAATIGGLGGRRHGRSSSVDPNHLRLAMMNRDFTGDDYEMLSALDERVKSKGASKSKIKELPRHKATEKDLANEDGTRATCIICFEELQLGEELRTMPCKHSFHGPCISKWLEINNSCPIDKEQL